MQRAAILASGSAGGLGDKRHGTRGARVDLEHVDFVILDRKLGVHQADTSSSVAMRAHLLAHASWIPR